MAWVITGTLEGKKVYYEKWAIGSASKEQPFYGEWLRKINISCIFTKRKEAVDLLGDRTEVDASFMTKRRTVKEIKVEFLDIGQLESKPKATPIAEVGARKLKL